MGHEHVTRHRMRAACPVPMNKQGSPPPCITNCIQVQAELPDGTFADIYLKEDTTTRAHARLADRRD
jgi:hypothetical protein